LRCDLRGWSAGRFFIDNAGDQTGRVLTLSSFAAEFKKAEQAALAAAGPKNVGYDVQLRDIDGWKK
jgi:hypothetical protein